MRNHTFRNVVAGAVLVFAAGACTDLGVEPRSTVTGANVFADLSAYESFLAKAYGGLSLTGQSGPAGQGDISGIDEGFSQYMRLLWQMQELPTDEAVIAWGDGPLQELNTWNWSPNNQFMVSMYYRVFFQVNIVNEFLRETDPDKLRSRGQDNIIAEVEQFRAEARFLRALSYWHGLDLFGSIPLVTEADVLGSAPTQVSSAELYDWLVSEINDFRDALPAAGLAEYGRADQAAADMLLAKVTMNGEAYAGSADFGSAFQAVQRVLSGPYQLADEYHWNFLADNHTSPEIIFPVPQDGVNTQHFGGTTFLGNAAVGGPMNSANYGVAGWWGLRPLRELVSKFPESGDARLDEIVYTEGRQPTITNLTDFQGGGGYYLPKYRNITRTGQRGADVTFLDTDYPMFRLADAYLMYAELAVRGAGGNTQQAVDYVNALRERAYGNADQNITANDLTLDFVLDERARELYWEGHRRTDLIRFGEYTQGVWQWKGGSENGSAAEACKVLYPLPATEFLANPSLEPNGGC